jgi:hemolysin III
MLPVPDRLTLGKMQNPVRGCLHGTAAIASVVGSIALWTRADPPRQFALLVFTISLVGLYSVSSLYHSVPWRAEWKHRMQRLDHSMIYVAVAGTYTPIAWIVLDGWLCAAALGIAWGIAALGIMQKIFLPKVADGFAIATATVQGWVALPLFVPLGQRLPPDAVVLLVLGGVLYTVGMICLVTERPRLWPRVFSYHEAFHVCVVAGSASHYAVMFGYLAQFTA